MLLLQTKNYRIVKTTEEAYSGELVDWYTLQHYNPNYDPEMGVWFNIEDGETLGRVFRLFISIVKGEQ